MDAAQNYHVAAIRGYETDQLIRQTVLCSFFPK